MSKRRKAFFSKGLALVLLFSMLLFPLEPVRGKMKTEADPYDAVLKIAALEKDIVFKGSSAEDGLEDGAEGPVINLTEEYFDPQTLSQYEAVTEGLPVNEEILWNLEMIGVGAETAALPVQEKVKVALLDSGVDYLENIDIKERINLIPDTEVSPLFEDYTGHGTAIASLLAASYDNVRSSVKGVNPNVELYSARILDENNEAPLSRVLDGIYWAIDKDVDIISISFGSTEYSEALELAINDAVSRGILVIASAGNNGTDGEVDYPAAFENVLSVGAVDSQGNLSEETPVSDKVDIAAPGVAVRVTGYFGEEAITSGTSMAVPHVVGVASLILQRDLSKDGDFVRTVLEQSGRSMLSAVHTVGVVDYNYANAIYDIVAEQYQNELPIEVEPNPAEVEQYDNAQDEMIVSGSWEGTVHQEYILKLSTEEQTADLKAMNEGAKYPDTDESKLSGMKDFPEFHGYFRLVSEEEPVNYVACYRYLIKIANEYGKGNNYEAVKQSDIPGLSQTSFDRIQTAFKNVLDGRVKKYSKNSQRKAFIFGVAMHTATDAFAHSTYDRATETSDWKRIKHTDETDPSRADNIDVKPRRHKMAIRVERNVVYRFQQKRAEVPVGHDFHAAGDTEGEFYKADLSLTEQYAIANLYENAVAAGVEDSTVLKHYGMISYKNTNYNEANGD